ncbi:MAG: cytochrome-c oxidase, cbb3-type subunit I, partial [Phyllobacteriaceae bacterium]|nr:cytochrome-c oxidase, cbb3-type subunit I [Phyllobacteriaceae bacterium]
MKNASWVVLVGAGAFLALLGAALGQDQLFRVHMGILTVVLLGSTAVLLRTAKFAPAGGDAASES